MSNVPNSARPLAMHPLWCYRPDRHLCYGERREHRSVVMWSPPRMKHRIDPATMVGVYLFNVIGAMRHFPWVALVVVEGGKEREFHLTGKQALALGRNLRVLVAAAKRDQADGNDR